MTNQNAFQTGFAYDPIVCARGIGKSNTILFRGKSKAEMNYYCVLFDLDGTLVDSRADLAAAINRMLMELGRQPLPESKAITYVGEGVRLFVERALHETNEEPSLPAVEIDHAIKIYRRHYREHLLDQTRVYPEVEETLEYLAPLPKAVVTNKPYEFTIALLDGIGLSRYFPVIFGGDSVTDPKPSPLMLLEAARSCRTEPSRCLMVGDSRTDIAAGKAAGMKTCGHIPGFRGRTELVEAGADFLIERFSELRELVGDLNLQLPPDEFHELAN